MKHDRGRALVRRVAKHAREQGWEAPGTFNIAEHERALIAGLYVYMNNGGVVATFAETRGQRRIGRKVAWACRNALLDFNEDRAAVSAALDQPVDLIEQGEPDWPAMAAWIEARLYELALGGERLSTQRRAVRGVRALVRLLGQLGRLGINAPIGRAPARDAPLRGTRDRVGYGEDEKGSTWLTEDLRNDDEGERSEPEEESEEGGGSPDPTRSGATRTREGDGEDGWDG